MEAGGKVVATAAGEAGASVQIQIPMPTLWALYKEQLMSPIAMFQLFCCVLWMLDEYWKYTLFTPHPNTNPT